ncbi:CHAT domain-containing protein, partial [Streptomyces sp. SID335]|nr:CHAT domain-containing protein [Streptomyces sp. SID335]
MDADVVFGPLADAELRGLLRTCDASTDMEARHAAGWLCAARAAASPGDGGTVHGCMAGTLLYPVWVAEPGAVPPVLAAGYAVNDPATHPDPADADGPHEWAAQVAAFKIVVEGRQHDPPPDAPEAERRLHELAVVLAALPLPPEVRLATALGLGSLAVLSTPEYDPWFPGRLRGVADLLTLTGASWPFGELAAAADPVRFVHGALKQIPAHSPERPRVLTGLARLLLDRYVDAHDAEDLHEAVGVARDVLAQLPPHETHLPHSLSVLGTALLLLRQVEGATPEECDEVVDVCRRAVAGHPRGPAAAGHDLGMALVLRAHHTGRTADLDEAVAVLTEALRAAGGTGEPASPPTADQPAETTALHNALRNALGNALRARSVATGSRTDLDAALAALTDRRTPPPGGTNPTETHPRRHPHRNLHRTPHPQPPLLAPAMALYSRYLLDPQANGADLEEAVRQLRYAEAHLTPGHPDRPAALDDLGLVLIACYQRSGKPEELNEAVSAHRESVALTRPGHGSLGLRLLNLGAALSLRHLLTEDGDDLRESRECRRQALDLPGMGPAHRAALLSSTGLSLITGFERAPAPVDRLDEAVGLLRDALALTPADDPKLPRRRHNLAVALMTRISQTMRIDEAREARELADAVIAALPPDSPDLPGALTVAAAARRTSLRALLSSTARDEVVALYR